MDFAKIFCILHFKYILRTILPSSVDKKAFDALMTSSSFLAKLIENEVLGIRMKFETKLGNYIIPKEEKYFVRTTRLFCQANQRILVSQQMIYWADKKISLLNKTILLGQQNSFVAQITTKLFCCGNKIFVGQA